LLRSITGPDAGMFVFGTGDTELRYTRQTYYSTRPPYISGGYTRSYGTYSTYSYGSSMRASSWSTSYERNTGYQWGTGYEYSQSGGLSWSGSSVGYALWAYPWLREMYGPYARGRIQAEPVSGTWQMPATACYTRDQSGNVVVIP
jgi:hypothetical protein